MKITKFGTKISLFVYFWIRSFVYFWIRSLKKYCHIWFQHIRISLIKNFRVKLKISKFGTKYILFGYFLIRIWKNYSHIWNQHHRIFLIAKFCEKKPKIFKFATKIALFGYFCNRTFKKQFSYLKSAPLNLSICKLLRTKKNV